MDLSFFNISLNEEQRIAVDTIEGFLESTDTQAFILKGYAGTGKTSVVQGIVKYLDSIKRPVILLASTGRAANILEKISEFKASTVHSHIYNYDSEIVDDNEKYVKFFFKIENNNNPENTVYIVDEASMLSDRDTTSITKSYGTGRLLSDFFEFINKRKVIFVGDPAQLPPVNALLSVALHFKALKERLGVNAKEVQLTQVMRFDRNSGIHYNAEVLRKKIEQKNFFNFKIEASKYRDIVTYPNVETGMIKEYCSIIDEHKYEKAIFVAYSNAEIFELNKSIRKQMGLNGTQISANEAIIVVQNNYLHNVCNGELLKVVYIDQESEIIKEGITFRNAELLYGIAPNQYVIKCKIIENLLYNKDTNLNNQQEYELRRFVYDRIIKRGIYPKKNPLEFMDALRNDQYYNALRIKFGYAITGHKAQGGEWENVFISYPKFFYYGIDETMHRWIYTTLTRASQKLHLHKRLFIY